MPELNRGLEFFYIIVLKPLGQRIQQELCVGLPGMPLCQSDAAIANGLGPNIDRTKVGPPHPADQPGPNLRINHPV